MHGVVRAGACAWSVPAAPWARAGPTSPSTRGPLGGATSATASFPRRSPVDGAPRIVPVNYAVVNDAVYFRTAVGTILNNAVAQRVAFEVDAFDARSRSGWSVCVVGAGRSVGEGGPDVAIDSWAPRRRDQRYCIVPEEITGRRLFGVPCGESQSTPRVRLFVDVLPVRTAEKTP